MVNRDTQELLVVADYENMQVNKIWSESGAWPPPKREILIEILLIMGVLGLLSLFLSGFLIVNTVTALLSQQKRQIGIMKALGAGTSQLLGMYLTMVLFYGVVALLIAAPLSIVGARELSRFMATMFNFNLTETPAPSQAILLQIAVGLLLPVLASLYPFLAGLRVTAAQAMSSYQMGKGRFGVGFIDRLLAGANLWFTRRLLIRPVIYPNLWGQALAVAPDGKGPDAEFNYNNYNTTLLGILLERTTHRPVAKYLQEKIWAPLGMEYSASWSLDSKESGFEATLCCVNGRAIDFAKFGRLFLHNGNWNDQQIISEQWVKESTSPYPTNPNGDIAWRANTWFSNWREPMESGSGYYKYQWWSRLRPNGSYDFIAVGRFGQRIYVSPQHNPVAVRFGISDEGVDASEEVLASVIAQVP